MSNSDLYNCYCLITNNQFMDIEIDEKKLSMQSSILFNKIITLFDNNDENFFIHYIKIKYLIHYIILCNIKTITEFNENTNNLLIYTRNNKYNDTKIHESKEIFNKIKYSIFDS